MAFDRKHNKVKVGDKVAIVRQDIFALNDVQGDKRVGTIKSIDGAYIMVKPRYRRWEIELYGCEIQKMETT